MGERKPRRLQPYARTIGKQEIPRVGETDFPREEHTDWVTKAKWPFLKTYI